MAKVFIGKEGYTYFAWDAETLGILPQPKEYIVEIPDTLLLEYTEVLEHYGRIQEQLRKYYESNPANQRPRKLA